MKENLCGKQEKPRIAGRAARPNELGRLGPGSSKLQKPQRFSLKLSMKVCKGPKANQGWSL